MDTEFRNIALVGRQTDARVAEPMRVLADYLTKAGIKVTAATSFYFFNCLLKFFIEFKIYNRKIIHNKILIKPLC